MDYNIAISNTLVQNNANHGLEIPSYLGVKGIFSDYRKYVLNYFNTGPLKAYILFCDWKAEDRGHESDVLFLICDYGLNSKQLKQTASNRDKNTKKNITSGI